VRVRDNRSPVPAAGDQLEGAQRPACNCRFDPRPFAVHAGPAMAVSSLE
jgi:hypothetical protein